jgi:hypothetical protein
MIRVQRTTELLEHLSSIRQQGSQSTLTLDESEFYSEMDWEQQCLPEDDEPGTRTRQGTDRSNTMLTIAWSPNGFRLIDAMPKREKHSAGYHINNIRTPIYQQLIPAGTRRLVIHPDNSRCETAKVVLDCASQSKVRFATHLPGSPDITPSNLFLFVCLKCELRGSRFQSAEELPGEVRNWWARSHLRLYWTFFTTGLHSAKV